MVKKKFPGLNSKYFFNIAFLFFSAFGLIFAVFAVQNKTNTRSDASGCYDKPKLILLPDKTQNYKSGVIFALKLINNCPNEKKFNISIKLPNEPKKYGLNDWRYYIYENKSSNNYSFNDIFLTNNIESNKTIYINVLPSQNIDPNVYKYFIVKASLQKNDNIFDTINLVYKVD